MAYKQETIDADFWRGVFGVEVKASEPKRIGEGQVGMNLRFDLESISDHVPASVVVKLASPDETSRATGIALRNYEREVKFYQQLVSSIDVRSPKCWFSDWNSDTGDIAIVLEDMSPAEQGDQIDGCGIFEAQLAIDQLVKIQGPRWADESLLQVDWLQRRGSGDIDELSAVFQMVLPGFLAVYTEAISNEVGTEGLEFVNALSTKIKDYVLKKDAPYTITHGDYRLDNLLFATQAGGVDCCVVDWQTPGHGNGVGDLAYFIGAGLLPEQRRTLETELVDRYIAGIENYGHQLDHDWVRDHYRREAISGVVMAVIASQIVGRTTRGDKMFEVMATRHLLQGLDNNSLGLL